MLGMLKKSGVLLALWSASVLSAVVVETEKAALENNEVWHELRAQVEASLTSGAWDSRRLEVRSKDGTLYKVTAANYAFWPAPLRRAVTDSMLSFYHSNRLTTFRVQVDTAKNNLAQEPVVEQLGIDLLKLTGLVPAEKLLSAYAQTWAYKMSPGYGPNCWHTSVASLFLNWKQPRRMPPAEFACHLRTSFVPIDKPSQWGDLIRLSLSGEEVHGFTYLGTDSKDATRTIVFTKNGRAQSHFLFMDLNTVKDYVYPGNEISYYRQVRTAVDPKEDTSAACAGFPDDETWAESDRDPIIEAGLRRQGNVLTLDW